MGRGVKVPKYTPRSTPIFTLVSVTKLIMMLLVHNSLVYPWRLLESLQGYLGDVRLAGQQPDVRSSLDRFERSREDVKRSKASPKEFIVFINTYIYLGYIVIKLRVGRGFYELPSPKRLT